MSNNQNSDQCRLLVVIINDGKASRVIQIAREAGVTGGTIILGRGTQHHFWLQLLELADVQKEIVLMVCENETIAQSALEILKTKLKMDRPNHGIAFTIAIAHFLGHQDYSKHHPNIDLSEELHMAHQVIFIIVEKGLGELAMKSANKAGAKGGTIINARGTGIHEHMRLFNMPIEPEKEILLIVSERSATETIVEAIKNDLNIEEPGKGIIFIQDVISTVGLKKD